MSGSFCIGIDKLWECPVSPPVWSVGGRTARTWPGGGRPTGQYGTFVTQPSRSAIRAMLSPRLALFVCDHVSLIELPPCVSGCNPVRKVGTGLVARMILHCRASSRRYGRGIVAVETGFDTAGSPRVPGPRDISGCAGILLSFAYRRTWSSTMQTTC